MEFKFISKWQWQLIHEGYWFNIKVILWEWQKYNRENPCFDMIIVYAKK